MSRYWLPLSLALFFITSLLLRILPPFHQIFTDLGVKFAMNDAYYHMRLIDNLAYNFPYFSYYDPYFVFPGTTVIGGAHFFDWLVASITWAAGLGSPTQATIDSVAVYLPPVLAALVVIPVYFIGKSIFNKGVGLIAAGLVAILPGEFLGRSILGAADHHVAEVLFSTTAVMFFMLASKSVSVKRTGIFTVLAGVFLGVYLLTWLGGLLFIAIISLFWITQVISNHLRGASSARIAVIVATMFAITLLLNYAESKEVLLFIGLSVALPAVLAALSWLMLKRNWHPVTFPATVIISGILFLVALNWLYPSFTSYLGMFLPSGSTATTTLELQPILSPHGQFTWSVLWRNFTTTAILAPVALIVLIVTIIRDKGKSETGLLLVIWSVVIIVLMLAQRRYAYYAVVNMSLLPGYLVCTVARYLAQVKVHGSSKYASSTGMSFVVTIVILALVPMNLSTSIQTAGAAAFAPSDAWQSAMVWLRDSTLEPFGRNIYDYRIPLLAKDLSSGEETNQVPFPKDKRYLQAPVPDYTVSAWWDYGYWITRIGHRVPNANPSQNTDAVERIATLFLSEGDEYHEQVDTLKSKYVVLDNSIARGKFYAVASWEGKDSSEYFGYYRVHDDKGYKTVLLFYPEYYKTFVSRLYNFNGEVVIPSRTVVITYKDDTVLEAKEFADYQKAVKYTDSTPGTRIVSADPTISPVPLAGMDYELVYSSKELVNDKPDVKIFEYGGKK